MSLNSWGRLCTSCRTSIAPHNADSWLSCVSKRYRHTPAGDGPAPAAAPEKKRHWEAKHRGWDNKPRWEDGKPTWSSDKPKWSSDKPRRDNDKPWRDSNKPWANSDKPRWSNDRSPREGGKPRWDSSHPKGTFDWGKPAFRPNRHAPAFAHPVPKKPYVPPSDLKLEDVPKYFANNVNGWATDPDTLNLLASFGLPAVDAKPLLEAYVAAAKSGALFENDYEFGRFAEPTTTRQDPAVLFCNIFYAWATEPSQRAVLSEKVNPSTLDNMVALVAATDRTALADQFPMARRRRRKIIMHVGPTNSGKTHWALRALAAADKGVYAGPLRLLAHEVWERLNLGLITPLGTEENTFTNPDTALIADMPHRSTVESRGTLSNARLTNMVTGEEQKIVAHDAPLLSCTVEMLKYYDAYDVAVVDEIQMISDPQRGSAWTDAVLGISAKELHLCGEETAIPVVENLLKSTGDELIIRRYERLTPLAVEEESLGGTYKNIRKGDAIVAFSRTGIFAVKRKVESMTGLRCAVVYGRLPPEIRSEQAMLFNDPNSGYDVLIGSDAIGMGLNLKIRRVVFDSVRKHTPGQPETLLSTSQIKQIAGRAGRFGLHESPGGFATTLYENDMSYLRECVASSFQSLPFARIRFDQDTFARVLALLPASSPTRAVVDAHLYIGRLAPGTRYQAEGYEHLPTLGFLDEYAPHMSVPERVLHLNAPVQWRDANGVEVMRAFMIEARDKLYVDLAAMLEKNPSYLAEVERIEKAAEAGTTPHSSLQALYTLESAHKALVLYIWLSFRLPVMYPQHALAQDLKVRVERAMEWALEGMSNRNHIKSVGKAAGSKKEEGEAGSAPKLEYMTKAQATASHTKKQSVPMPARYAIGGKNAT